MPQSEGNFRVLFTSFQSGWLSFTLHPKRLASGLGNIQKACGPPGKRTPFLPGSIPSLADLKPTKQEGKGGTRSCPQNTRAGPLTGSMARLWAFQSFSREIQKAKFETGDKFESNWHTTSHNRRVDLGPHFLKLFEGKVKALKHLAERAPHSTKRAPKCLGHKEY